MQLADRILFLAKGVFLSTLSPQALRNHSLGEWFYNTKNRPGFSAREAGGLSLILAFFLLVLDQDRTAERRQMENIPLHLSVS